MWGDHIPLWVYVTFATACGVGFWLLRPKPPSEAPHSVERMTGSIHHFTKEEALALIRKECPVYWRIPGIRRINAKATRKEAERLLAVFEDEHPLEVDEYGYDKLALGVRVGVEKMGLGR